MAKDRIPTTETEGNTTDHQQPGAECEARLERRKQYGKRKASAPPRDFTEQPPTHLSEKHMVNIADDIHVIATLCEAASIKAYYMDDDRVHGSGVKWGAPPAGAEGAGGQ